MNIYNNENLISGGNIRELYLNFDIKKQKTTLKNLSSKERKILMKIVKEKSIFEEKEITPIFNQIKKIHETIPNLTKKNYKVSYLSKISKKFTTLLKNILWFFDLKDFETSSKELNIDLKNDKNLKLVTEKKFKNLLKKEIKNNSHHLDFKINVQKLLTDNGFKPTLHKLDLPDIKLDLPDIKNLDYLSFNGVTFSECSFNWTPLSNCEFQNVSFIKCKLQNTAFVNAKLEKCKFTQCQLREVMFTAAHLESVTFNGCSIISSSFEDAFIINTKFEKSNLSGSHFLEASIAKTSIKNCNLNDTVFFGNLDKFTFFLNDSSKQSAKLTKPVTAVLIDPEVRGITWPKVFLKLDQAARTIPLRISIKNHTIQKEDINKEIESALENVKLKNDSTPIPQQLLQEITNNPHKYPNGIKILNKSKCMSQEVNSFLLTGGEDVSPALYGKELQKETDWGGDYRRSILEFGMIQEAQAKGIPLMAICRGFQITNVFYGANLIQHVDGHKKLQKLKLTPKDHLGIFHEAMKNPIISASMHHQGIPETEPAKNYLENSVVFNGIVKAAEAKASGNSPIMLLQFHPEFLNTPTAHSMAREFVDMGLSLGMSKENDIFWEILSDSGKAHRNKMIFLQNMKQNPLFTRHEQVAEIAMHSKRVYELKLIENRRDSINRDLFLQHANFSRGLIQSITNKTNLSLLIKYLAIPEDGAEDRYQEERKIIEDEMKRNPHFKETILQLLS